jgi:hypothetical protein
MAFTNTTLSITPLLETTFISDMRIIVNSNSTVLKSKVEDIINTLQIDLVNKYLGVDLPLSQIYTHDLIVSNRIQFKNGTGAGAGIIGSLTQTSGISTFLADNINFTATMKATANTSRAALKTVVVGGTGGATDLTFPTSGGAGVPDPGLYVGDVNTPVSAGFYGDVKVEKRAITQSTNGFTSPRVISMSRFSGSYSYGSLSLSRNDPQFIIVNLQMDDNLQDDTKPIWLGLHEDFTTQNSRPYVGQSFTIIINKIFNLNSTEVGTSGWPTTLPVTNTNGGIAIIPGWTQSGTSGTNALKLGYLNNSVWNPTGFPTSGVSAVAQATNSTGMNPKTWIRLYSEGVQADTNVPDSLGACVTLTKLENSENTARYIVTGGSNYSIVNV